MIDTPEPVRFYAYRSSGKWAVFSNWCGMIEDGYDCQAAAEYAAEEMQAEHDAAEKDELEADA